MLVYFLWLAAVLEAFGVTANMAVEKDAGRRVGNLMFGGFITVMLVIAALSV